MQSVKASISITTKNKDNIIELLNNLKDKNNNLISYLFQDENIKKKLKKKIYIIYGLL